jgi:hypothetical protein
MQPNHNQADFSKNKTPTYNKIWGSGVYQPPDVGVIDQGLEP